ncbi:MAG: DUF1846 domain-containing protein [Sphaerochaetaceae bacterium]|nr:DUF1846 domain-containing protein [Sphaerochaetaceae bacterium]
MMIKKGFDNQRYLEKQTQAILERMEKFHGKLYLECGGKLLYDYHAARVLPGFDPNVKIEVFKKLKDKIDVIICIYAGDIERKKIRGDFGITYDVDTLKMIDDFSNYGLRVKAVVITRYEEQPSATQFKQLLERRGISVYTHKKTKGYPTDIDLIVSEEGYGANSYIETDREIVIVTAPGPGSGKLATCLSQLYHDHQRGLDSGYAKFETFPVWDLSLNHLTNVAYEAATADLGDINRIDHFHLEAYGKTSINYNRDLDAFPLLKRIIEKITKKKSFYKSPTDMGVNRIAQGIIDDEICQEASKQEIIRRYYRSSCEYAMGFGTKEAVDKEILLMEDYNIKLTDRSVVSAAKSKREEGLELKKGSGGIVSAAALKLSNDNIITALNSELLHSSSALILNAIKTLAGIPDEIDLIPKSIVESIKKMKQELLKSNRVSLDVDEVLIALAVSAASNPAAEAGMKYLSKLSGTDAHLTHIPTSGDEAGLRKLGINVTSEPKYASKQLFNA